MFQSITRPLKRWLRRLSVGEPKAEDILRDRTRAHVEIAEALIDIFSPEGWQKLDSVVSRNRQILSSKTLMLTNAILFVSPNSDEPDIEFLKRRLQLVDHLREELRLETVEKELRDKLGLSEEERDEKD